MDYGQAFTFIPNSSKDWITKAAMGVVFAVGILFFGFGLVALVGWEIAIARRVIRGEADPLPEWSDLGQIIINGLTMFVLVFLWLLPLWILTAIASLLGDQTVVSIILYCCAVIYGIPIGILLIGAYCLIADERSFSEVLNPVNAFRVVSASWANTIIVFLLGSIAYSLVTSISILLCGVGIFVGIPFGFSIQGHLYGQLYRESQANVAIT